MKRFASQFMPGFATTIAYMLQSTEYQVRPYLRWYWRTDNFLKVMYRRSLIKTKAANLLVTALYLGMLTQVLTGLFLLWTGYNRDELALTLMGIVVILSYPFIWAHLVVIPLWFGRVVMVNPKNRSRIKKSKQIFAQSKAIKIAVAGSYGKTSMKELLGTVLSEGKKVAITPANKNVSISHAIFAQKLKGDEEVLVIEYGEGEPGDVARFAAITQPSIGVITGLAPAHLDHYPTLKAAGEDIFSLSSYVGADNTYVNKDSEATKAFIRAGMHTYDSHEVQGWKITDVKIDFSGTKFAMKKKGVTLHLHSGLLGRHQVGPLAVVVALADNLGLSKAEIEAGIAKTVAFEHRMQARLIRGAWILDDTYNGNIDGMKAGLRLLKDLPGKRKIYVTPGLVDQGVETERVHKELGKEIAMTAPDKVVLMSNSATFHIMEGMRDQGYRGETQIEHDPLDFYTNIEHFIASGDVVMMQNDWTDNYN